jgi:hypothetical protein
MNAAAVAAATGPSPPRAACRPCPVYGSTKRGRGSSAAAHKLILQVNLHILRFVQGDRPAFGALTEEMMREGGAAGWSGEGRHADDVNHPQMRWTSEGVVIIISRLALQPF